MTTRDGGVRGSDSLRFESDPHPSPLLSPNNVANTRSDISYNVCTVLSGGKRRIIVQEVQKYRILREIIVYRIIGRYLLLLSPAVYFACPPPPLLLPQGFLFPHAFFSPPLICPLFLSFLSEHLMGRVQWTIQPIMIITLMQGLERHS